LVSKKIFGNILNDAKSNMIEKCMMSGLYDWHIICGDLMTKAVSLEVILCIHM
jgi:hypothetical protein